MTQDVQRANGIRAWLDRAAPELGTALGDPGAPVTLKSVSATELEDGAVREALPAACSAFVSRFSRGEIAGPILLLLPPAAARRAVHGAAADAEARCASEEPLDDEEKAALGSRAEAVGAALELSLGAAVEGATADAAAAIHLVDSEWSAEDPLVPGLWVCVELEVTVNGVEAASARVLVSAGVIDDVLPGLLAAGAAPAAGTRSGVLAFAASADIKARIGEALGVVEECGGLDALVAAWSRSDVEGAVVEVPPGSEYMLATIRGLTEFPGCEGKPVVILLGEPTERNVIRCGRLGLFDVLPPDFEPDELRRRTTPTQS